MFLTHLNNNILIMSIQFPILNISLSNLSSQDLEETHIGDLWDYPGDNSIFEEYYNNQKYVDQSGHIFKIIGKRKSNFINSIIHFNKKELIFEDCGETISFSVLKDFLINRYNSLDDNLAKSVLIRLTKQSKNIVSVSAMLVYTRQKNIAQVFILERYFFVSIYLAAIPGTYLMVFLVVALLLCLLQQMYIQRS